jgi:hypothetical protein
MLKREREGAPYPCVIGIGEAVDPVAYCGSMDSRESRSKRQDKLGKKDKK